MHGTTTDVEVIAHRGASAYRPEHSLAAYELALDQGADVLELDVRATADGALVIQHDPVLPRGATAPLTLDEVLTAFGRRTRYLVELKDPSPAWERSVLAALAEHGLTGHATLQSFDLASLARLGAGPWGPPVAALLTRRPRPATLDAIAAYAAAIGVWHPRVDEALVAAAHARGLGVRAWTVNAPRAIRRALAAGVDGVITDAPDVAVGLIAGRAMRARAA